MSQQGLSESPQKIAEEGSSQEATTIQEAFDRAVGVLCKRRLPAGSESVQDGEDYGQQPWPFDFQVALNYLTRNSNHSACIHAKVSATVGLGFRDPEEMIDSVPSPDEMIMRELRRTSPRNARPSRVARILNRLTHGSTFQSLLDKLAQDYWQTGNAYIEVVRNRAGAISGLYHLPVQRVWVYREGQPRGAYHYEYHPTGVGGFTNSRGMVKLACFGEAEETIRRNTQLARLGVEQNLFSTLSDEQTRLPEVIHIQNDFSGCRDYGFIDWMPAIPLIELSRGADQFQHDHIRNHGVPDLMVNLIGQGASKAMEDKIRSSFTQTVGLGNQHKVIINRLAVPASEARIEVEQLATDNADDVEAYVRGKEAHAQGIVTAHRVPPLLAGVLIPGKLGSTNELPNALLSFQVLVIDQAQKDFSETLGMTLGSQMGVRGIGPEDFEFRTLLDRFDLSALDTMSRMREPATSAQAEGRQLTDGLQD